MKIDPESAGLQAESQTKLLRILGVTFGLAVVIGGMIGAGILRTPGFVAGQLGSVWLIIGVWIFGGIYAFVGVNTYAELGTMLPRAGGPYAFARHTFGDYAGFLVGWSDWFLNILGTSYIAVALGEYTLELFPSLNVSPSSVSISALLFLGLLNWVGLRVGSGVQKLTSLIKVIAFAVVIAACFVYGGKQSPSAESTTVLLSSPMTLLAGVVLALQAVFETYSGWNQAVYFSEEDTNPAKNLPRAMFGGVLIVMAIYVLFNVAMIYVLPVPDLAASKLPAADAARVVFGAFSGQLVTAIALVSLLGILNVGTLTNPRVIFALARDGLFFSKFAKVNRGGTPSNALFLSVFLSVVLSAAGSFETLIAIASFMGLVVNGTIFLAIFVLRKREPEASRPFKAVGYPILPASILIVSIMILIAYVVGDPLHSLMAVAVMALSYPLFLMVRRAVRTA